MSPHLDELGEVAGGDGSSGLLCLNCNPDPDKQQKMDGLMAALVNFTVCNQLYSIFTNIIFVNIRSRTRSRFCMCKLVFYYNKVSCLCVWGLFLMV